MGFRVGGRGDSIILKYNVNFPSKTHLWLIHQTPAPFQACPKQGLDREVIHHQPLENLEMPGLL